VLPFSDFVPKWQASAEGEEPEVNEDQLRTKVAAAFGAAFAEKPASGRTSG
jgi:hypothetical protein